MTKTLATTLSLFLSGAALAEPDPIRESSRPTPVEEADRRFLAEEATRPTTAPIVSPAPAAPPAPVAAAATGPASVAATSVPVAREMSKTSPAQPKTAASSGRAERTQPRKVAQKAPAKVKTTKNRIAAQKPPTIRRSMPILLPPSYTTRTESRDRVVVKHYEFTSQDRVRITTTVTRYEDDRDEDEDDD